MSIKGLWRLVFVGGLAALAWLATLLAPMAVAAHDDRWRGEYFNNRFFSGSPTLVRRDGDIDFDWGDGSPDGRIRDDNFSVRWTRAVYLDEGRYRFETKSDDGVRLYVDGRLVIDEWHEASSGRHSAKVRLGDGNHQLRLEYYERGGNAHVQLQWEQVEQSGSALGNILTCVRPVNSWIKVYRLDGSGWTDVNPHGWGPLNVRGDLKLDGMQVDVARYGDAGHPYRVELWADGSMVGQAEIRVRSGADSATPWGCPAP